MRKHCPWGLTLPKLPQVVSGGHRSPSPYPVPTAWEGCSRSRRFVGSGRVLKLTALQNKLLFILVFKIPHDLACGFQSYFLSLPFISPVLQRFFLFLINTEFSHLLEAISLCWNGIFYGFHKILRTIKLPSPQRKTLELPQHFVLLSGHSGHIYVLGWIPTWLQQAWFLCKLCEKIQWNQRDSFKPTEVATLKAMTLAKGKTKCPTYSCKHRSAAWSQTPSRRLGLGKSLLSMPTGHLWWGLTV